MLTKLFISLDYSFSFLLITSLISLDSSSCVKTHGQYLSCFYQIKNERSRTEDRVKSFVFMEMTLAGIISEFILLIPLFPVPKYCVAGHDSSQASECPAVNVLLTVNYISMTFLLPRFCRKCCMGARRACWGPWP